MSHAYSQTAISLSGDIARMLRKYDLDDDPAEEGKVTDELVACQTEPQCTILGRECSCLITILIPNK